VCSIPTGGLTWKPLRQPVVLEQWPVSRAGRTDRFTTIASWRGAFGAVEHGGKVFGLKVHEFRKVILKVHEFRKMIELPRRSPAVFELALDIHESDARDRTALEDNGWRIVNPQSIARDPKQFRDYIQHSGAEFSVAQGIYAETSSGWFSDRTTRYLASGKPALVQDTGFSRNLPVGDGLVAFSSLDEAVSGAERIVRDYEHHSRAARHLAEEYFNSDVVLHQFLDNVGLVP
jgi:hypothetical protein